jgi:hypothetical protein
MSHGMVLIRLLHGRPWLPTCLCGWHGRMGFLLDARQEWITHAGVTDPLLAKEEE